MQHAPEALWDPADTDGLSEDWLHRLVSLSAKRTVLDTPVGVVFTRLTHFEQLLSHPSLKVPIIEQYQRLGVAGPILERLQRVILGLEGAEHARLRKLVNRAFTPRAIERLGETMRAFLKPKLDDADGVVDFLRDVVGEYPAAIISGLLGLPASDLPHLTAIAETITSAQFSLNVERAKDYMVAAAECDSYLGELVTFKRNHPGDDILTQLTRVEIDGDSLSDAEIVSLCSSLMIAGIDTTRNQAALGMTLFSRYPDEWQRLRAKPDLAANAVEEMLRFLPVTPLLSRINTEPIHIDNVDLPSGTYISLAVAAVNRDNELNQGDTDAFDISRPKPRHFTFGHGAHFCLGASLARLEMQQLLSQMAQRFRHIEVVGDAPRRPVLGVYGVTSLSLQLIR